MHQPVHPAPDRRHGTRRDSLPPSYFDEQYARTDDPWGLAERWYEQRKYALTLAALPRRRYRTAFEPGCSIGVLTAQLAGRCDRLVATDVTGTALSSARARVADLPHVEARRWALGDAWPPEMYDLVVLSEVGYYLGPDDLPAVLAETVEHLEPGGTLLAVHWRHDVADYPLSGDEVHAEIAATGGLARLGGWADADVLLEVWTAGSPPVRSVATDEGLV